MPSLSDIREGFRLIRSLLTDLITEQPSEAPRIAEILRAVDAVERQVDATLPAAMAEGPRQTRGTPKTYAIEKVGNQEILAEYRPDDQNPFHCPRATYDALARVFARTDRFVKYRELMKGLGREMKPLPADYQIRVVLRFWAQPGVALIERVRARYRPRDAQGFITSAKRVWEQAAGTRPRRYGAV